MKGNTRLQRFFRICAFVACDFLMNQIVDTIIACYAQVCFSPRPFAPVSDMTHRLIFYKYNILRDLPLTKYIIKDIRIFFEKDMMLFSLHSIA